MYQSELYSVPDLSFEYANMSAAGLREDPKVCGTLLIFYRGLHSESCVRFLTGLAYYTRSLTKLGIEVVAVSADDRQRAMALAARLGRTDLRIAYGLSQEDAEVWGLESLNIAALPFFEPAIFVLNKQRTQLYASPKETAFAMPEP